MKGNSFFKKFGKEGRKVRYRYRYSYRERYMNKTSEKRLSNWAKSLAGEKERYDRKGLF